MLDPCPVRRGAEAPDVGGSEAKPYDRCRALRSSNSTPPRSSWAVQRSKSNPRQRRIRGAGLHQSCLAPTRDRLLSGDPRFLEGSCQRGYRSPPVAPCDLPRHSVGLTAGTTRLRRPHLLRDFGTPRLPQFTERAAQSRRQARARRPLSPAAQDGRSGGCQAETQGGARQLRASNHRALAVSRGMFLARLCRFGLTILGWPRSTSRGSRAQGSAVRRLLERRHSSRCCC